MPVAMLTTAASQPDVDRANGEFWNELCGTGLAQHLGIKDHSPESLRRFDQGFLDLYPYFLPLIRPERMRGQDVLEIGLGYGTLGQILSESGAEYTGLDIAENPVRMMNNRMLMQSLTGRARQGSALDMPFPDASFDFVISIGCFHHTGDVQRCIDESHRVLRPRGKLIFMVYNRYGLRQWLRWPLQTVGHLLRERFAPRRHVQSSVDQRAAYDPRLSDGAAAPMTDFLSIYQLKHMLQKFTSAQFKKRNCDDLYCLGKLIARRIKMLPILGPTLGLDIYVEASK